MIFYSPKIFHFVIVCRFSWWQQAFWVLHIIFHLPFPDCTQTVDINLLDDHV